MTPEDRDPKAAPELNRTEARQGTTRFPLRHVLIASLILAVIAFVVAFLAA